MGRHGVAVAFCAERTCKCVRIGSGGEEAAKRQAVESKIAYFERPFKRSFSWIARP